VEILSDKCGPDLLFFLDPGKAGYQGEPRGSNPQFAGKGEAMRIRGEVILTRPYKDGSVRSGVRTPRRIGFQRRLTDVQRTAIAVA
jgi:hypothetical protein